MSTLQQTFLNMTADDFQFNDAVLGVAISISSLCIGYVLFDFILNKKSRHIPSRLMVVRAIFNYIAIMIVLITVNYQEIISNDMFMCEFQGALFLFSLYVATIYYALICWELYLTLNNPFRAPSSGSILFHTIALSICFFVVFGVAISDNFKYRNTFKICFIIESNASYNALNWCLIYIPTFGICLGGFIATGWSVKRLKATIIDETFELRWLLIKQQTVIITCFSINYALQMATWILLYSNTCSKCNPYFLTAFCFIGSIFDAITWITRKYIKQISQLRISSIIPGQLPSPSPKLKRKKTIKNISDALRKEVITCIIDGLAKSAEKRINVKQLRSGQASINAPITNISSNLLNEKNNDYRSILDQNSLFPDDYPSKLDGKEKPNVIERYEVETLGAHKSDGVFTDYAPKIFVYLRENIYGISSESYYDSILPINDVSKVSLELVAKFSEGRSGAFFFFTKDMKYLIKTLTKSEAQLLLDTLKNYVNFMTNNRKTYLSKYFGLHSIKLYGHSIYFVVNKNIFSSLEKDPDEKYDIKGSWIDRNTNYQITDRKLMKDSDLKKSLLLNRKKSMKIYNQLAKDTMFLGKANIMDYSLLLGIVYVKLKYDRGSIECKDDLYDEELKHDSGSELLSENDEKYEIMDAEAVEGPGIYCIGIIDMLQKWDLNKKSERFVKA
eukprot:533441_1